jgi:ABC-type multidrug transport system fused ATPase/permease subunit
MKTSRIIEPKNSLFAKLSYTALLFFGAFILDSLFESLSLYPIYLASILYASINLSFYFSASIAMLAAYGSLHTSNISSLESINIFIVRTIILVTIAYLFSTYLGLVKTYRRRLELLTTMIPQCHDCGAVLCSDGEWRSIEQISARPELVGLNLSHGCKLETDTKSNRISK